MMMEIKKARKAVGRRRLLHALPYLMPLNDNHDDQDDINEVEENGFTSGSGVKKLGPCRVLPLSTDAVPPILLAGIEKANFRLVVSCALIHSYPGSH